MELALIAVSTKIPRTFGANLYSCTLNEQHERITWGFMQVGHDKQCSTLVLTSSKYFQSAAARADGILFPNLHKACTLAVIANDFATTIHN